MNTSIVQKNKGANQIVSQLSVFLADTYVLYVKTQNFHWNVTDPRFFSLHSFFEEQYTSLADAIDVIAERIRMLHAKTPASLSAFLDLTRLEEAKGELTADAMLEELLQDHQSIIDWIKPEIERSSNAGDEGTADMLIQRLRAHEKAAWMIRSQLEGT